MPAYGHLQWGSCGTIINPQMTVDYLTVAGPAQDYPLDVQLETASPCDAAYRKDDGTYQRFVAPDVDPAPWYDATMGANDVNASAQFLGLIISNVEGLEDSTAAREMTPRAVGVGGGSLGPLRMNGRTMKFTATMYATSCRGMDYGMRWLSNTLRGRPCSADDTCTLQVWTGCPDVSNLVRAPEDVQWVLHDVALTDGPKVTTAPLEGYGGSLNCYVREVEWTLASEHPYLFKCPADAVAYSALSSPVSGTVSILQWLRTTHQVNLFVEPVNRFGEELVTIELTAGSKPLNCDVRGWVSPFPQRCSSLEAPNVAKTYNPNGLAPWLYEVGAGGAWNRYQLSDDGVNVVGTVAASGTGPIYGTATPGATGTYRDIRVEVLGAISRSDNQPVITVAHFNDLSMIGGEINQNGATPSYSSGYTSSIGVKVSDFTGVAHLEGLRIKGTGLQSGVSVGSTGVNAGVQVRNVRVESPLYNASATKNSGTGLYLGSRLFSAFVDGLSVKATRKYGVRIAPTDGYTMAASGGYISDVVMRRVNVDTDTGDTLVRHPFWVGSYSYPASGTYTRSGVRISDYWGVMTNGYEGADDFLASTTPASGYPYTSVVDSKGRTVLTWPSAARIDGAAYRGTPADGDFVPAASVGSSYSQMSLLDDEDACATYYVRNLPAGYKLVIDPSVQRVLSTDKAGVVRDGSPYIQLPDKKAISWLIFDCQPLCLNIDQMYAGSGDGATVKVTRTHREV
jgi:hypothetical protein